MSIASWASKDDRILTSPEKSAGAVEEDRAKKEEFEARAAAWAESQKCKLASRHEQNLLNQNFLYLISVQLFGSKSTAFSESYLILFWLIAQISEEGGEDTGMGELPEIQI
jgi:hypothetical protein